MNKHVIFRVQIRADVTGCAASAIVTSIFRAAPSARDESPISLFTSLELSNYLLSETCKLSSVRKSKQPLLRKPK